MKVIRPFQISFNNTVFEQDRRFYFTASLTIGFNLRTNEELLEFDFIKDATESMGENPLPDMGMPKPGGEILISGCFFPPNKEPAASGWVRATVGHQKKELFVFGPRKWRNGFPTNPEPFTSMPIDYAHAFGGEGYQKNPNGIGFKDGKIPCIEDPKHLVASPTDTPDPAGFSVLDPFWPQRMRFQGTYDNSYIKKYFPGYPADFDWQYFHCAPEDQWIKGYFKGDEPFEIHHMHPDHPVIRGNLPGLYARCFLNHTLKGDHAPQFSELPLNLDTLWFFPEKLLGLMIWRGVIQVADDEAEQIQHMIVAYEDRSDSPRSHEHYRDTLERRINSDDALLNYFNTEDLIPIGAKCAMELLQERAFEDHEESEFAKNMDAKSESLKKMADEKIEEAIQQSEKGMQGMDIPDDFNKNMPDDAKAYMPGGEKMDLRKMFKEASEPKPDPDVEALNEKLETILPGITAKDPRKLQLKNFSFDKIDKIMATVDEFMEKKKKQALDTAKPEIEKAKTQIREQMENLKSQEGMENMPEEAKAEIDKAMATLEESLQMMDVLDPESEAELPKAPLPRMKADEIRQQLSTVSPQVAEAMQHVQAMKDMGIENEATQDMEKQINEIMDTSMQQVEEGLADAEKAFKETYIMGAHFMADGLSPHDDPVETVAERFKKALAEGEDLTNGDWACIDLSGQNLDGIDLSRAFLEQVNFTGASLKNANLSRAILARADLTDADLSGANLEEANVGAVKGLRTNFTDANLKSARLSKADFTEADFTRADLTDTETLYIILNRAKFTETRMPTMKFIESKLEGPSFIKADMTTSVFYDCDITDADFSEAILHRCVFADVRLENVVFDKADMTSACFAATDPAKSSFTNVCFKGACMNRCSFQSMVMKNADLSGASMENANFINADLSCANLSRAYARYAMFRKSNLMNANLKGINLMEGSLAKARLSGTTFAGANLYGVDFLRSIMGETNFSDCNLDRTLIQDWRPL